MSALKYLFVGLIGLGSLLQSAQAQSAGAQSVFQEAQKIMQSLQQEGYTVEWVHIDMIDSLKQVQREIGTPKEYGLFVVTDEAIVRTEVAITQQQSGEWKPYYRADSEDKNFVFATLMQDTPQNYRIEVRSLQKQSGFRQAYFALILFHE